MTYHVRPRRGLLGLIVLCRALSCVSLLTATARNLLPAAPMVRFDKRHRAQAAERMLCRGLAVAMALLMVGLSAFAVRPDWHRAVHATDPLSKTIPADHGHGPVPDNCEHDCPIERLATGSVLVLEAPPWIQRTEEVFDKELAVLTPCRPLAPCFLLPPGRAPPFFV